MVKILVADDDDDILELLEYNLTKEGYFVVTAKDGREAMKMADLHSPELIILDVMMPNMDGVEVCEKLRLLPKYENTIILFLTARTEDFTQIACYECGGDDYIVKPVKPKVLISRIKAIMRRQKGGASAIVDSRISLGDILIDIEQHSVSKNGEMLALPKKEFELLLLLVSKPGKLFSRDEIFNKVWGIDTIIGDRTIDVHVRKLREKLGDEYIKTVKGIGYKFEID